jgi:TetR/AcrR family transcriptional repressor of nem operon
VAPTPEAEAFDRARRDEAEAQVDHGEHEQQGCSGGRRLTAMGRATGLLKRVQSLHNGVDPRELTLPKPSHREKLLEEGLKVVLSQGYNGASVRDIVRAAAVPQGSFTNHFSSKEAFAQEVLDRYFSTVSSKIENTLRNDSLPPLQRLRAWLDAQIDFLKQSKFRSGCLIGNFTMEASSQSGSIRRRLAAIIQNIEGSLAYCLNAAVDAGELSASTDVGEVASFVYSSWQGAILQAKVEQRAEPLERYKNVVFSQLLR